MLSFSLLAGAFLCLSIEQRFACSRFFRTDVLSSQHRDPARLLSHYRLFHENFQRLFLNCKKERQGSLPPSLEVGTCVLWPPVLQSLQSLHCQHRCTATSRIL